jgi:signal peptidase II
MMLAALMQRPSQATSRWLIGTGAFAFFGFDQATKWLIHEALLPGESFTLLPHVFQLTLTFNTGAAFSMLETHPEFLVALSTVILLALLTFAFTRKCYRRGEVLSLALLIGGTFGNLLDRLLIGHVTDFFDLVWIHYPIFNMADIFILFGSLGLFLTYWQASKTAFPEDS